MSKKLPERNASVPSEIRQHKSNSSLASTINESAGLGLTPQITPQNIVSPQIPPKSLPSKAPAFSERKSSAPSQQDYLRYQEQSAARTPLPTSDSQFTRPIEVSNLTRNGSSKQGPQSSRTLPSEPFTGFAGPQSAPHNGSNAIPITAFGNESNYQLAYPTNFNSLTKSEGLSSLARSDDMAKDVLNKIKGGGLIDESSMGSISPDIIDGSNASKPRSLQALLKNLESRSKPELLGISKKMVSEINIKNRIISENKTNEKWMLAELVLAQESPMRIKVGATELQSKYAKTTVSPQDKEFLQMLMAFKAELSAAKKIVEEHEVSLIILEKKRTAAEEEAQYLRTIIDPKIVDPTSVQTQRISELEGQLSETIQDFTVLQSKVAQWARASKRNQEGRISAEAIQKVLEQDRSSMKTRLNTSKASEAVLRSQMAGIAGSIEGGTDASVLTLLTASQTQIQSLEEQLIESQTEVLDLERNHEAELVLVGVGRAEMMEAMEELRVRNIELSDSVGAKNEYQDIIKNRSSNLFMNMASAQPLTSLSSKDLDREFKLLMDKYETMETENGRLEGVEKGLLLQIEDHEKTYEKLERTVEDQEELLNTVKQVKADKKTLQAAYDAALDKIQQKQISIEMLQVNMDRARDRLEPYQKSMEDLDDLQDTLQGERAEMEVMRERLLELEADCIAQQDKIISLSEKLEDRDGAAEPTENEAIKELQERIGEYRHMNDMLALQLEERTQDVEMLESRLEETFANKDIIQNAVSKQGLSLAGKSPGSPISPTEHQDFETTKRELESASTILAQQLITIQKLEEVIGEDNEVIVGLKAEKSKLNQKVSLMQQIKADYDNQTADFEKLQMKLQNFQSTVLEIPDLKSQVVEENAALVQELEDQKELVVHLQEALGSITNEKIELQEQQEKHNDAGLLEKVKSIEERDLKLALHQQEIDARDREIDTIKEKMEELQDIITTHEEEKGNLDAYKDEMHLQSRKKSVEAQEIRSKLDEYLQDVEGKARIIRDLEHQIKDAQVRIEQLEIQTNNAAEESIGHSRDGSVQRLQNEVNTMKGEKESRDVEVKGITDELDTVYSQLEELKTKHRDLTVSSNEHDDTVTGLREQLDHHTGIANDALMQIEEYENEILELRPKAEDSKQLLAIQSKLEKSVADKGAELEQLHIMNEQLLDKIASLSLKMAHADNNRLSVNPLAVQKKDNDLEISKKELAELSTHLDGAMEKIHTFQLEKQSLLEQIDDLRDLNLAQQKSLDSFKST